ncbi:MAG: 3-isopropylmalate dehydratase [Planctomycetota bacterium]|nr:MAG: 3-isopropylmalate dehydratase [Planctomycetota bacterium]
MEEVVKGKVYVLGDNIDTDQIIPAQYLVYNPAVAEERKLFGRYALSGVPVAKAGLPGGGVSFIDQVDESRVQSEFTVIVAGKNLGCGSSREHAPLALQEAGVGAVIAESYARIFYRNSVNGGYLIPFESTERLIEQFSTGDEVEVRCSENCLINLSSDKRYGLKSLGEAASIIEAGGLFEYAKRCGML